MKPIKTEICVLLWGFGLGEVTNMEQEARAKRRKRKIISQIKKNCRIMENSFD
jgi:hypothetical protein